MSCGLLKYTKNRFIFIIFFFFVRNADFAEHVLTYECCMCFPARISCLIVYNTLSLPYVSVCVCSRARASAYLHRTSRQ